MAASASASGFSLEEDLSCSVCCDVFREPVLLGCGHSFCRECLTRHWSSSRGRRCPVCRTASPQEPLPNINLRSTCESFLRQRKKALEEAEAQRKKEEEKVCAEHGLKLAFYCETEAKIICSECKKSAAHMGHNVLLVQKAVKQRKARLAAATAPLKQRLNSLMYGSAESPTAADIIKAIVEKCEAQIQKDFETLFTFLKEEQQARLTALKDAGKRETQRATDVIEAEVTLLSNRLQEAEEMAQKDAITFLEEFDTIMPSLQHSEAQPVQSPLEVLDVSRRLGNLRFNVWKQMKEVAPFYPVILDPNGPQVGIVLSDDLTSVEGDPIQDPSCPLSNHYAFVLGSEPFTGGYHVWDVHVGDSSDWMVGVTSLKHIPVSNIPHSIAPGSGYWAIQRKNGQYLALTLPQTPLNLPSSGPLQVLRVKVRWAKAGDNERKTDVKVTFSDAQRGLQILKYTINNHWGALYPFLCPLGRGAKLRLEPAKVKVEVRDTMGFWEKYESDILLCGIFIFIFICFYINQF